MRYAESLLLGGQLINVEEVDEDTYNELICVCPHCKNKVSLAKSYIGEIGSNQTTSLGKFWMHQVEPEFDQGTKCIVKNENYYYETDITDEVARLERINLLKPNLIKLIKSSAILEQPVTLEALGDTLNDSLIKWFAERLKHFTFDGMFQDTARMECQDLYGNCIRPALADKKHWISKENTDNFTTHNHLFYGSKIAGEMLEYALVNFDGKDRRILIYLGINEAVQESMQLAAFALSNLVNSLLKGKEKSDFQQLWVGDKYQGMNEIREVAKKDSDFCVLYNKYTKNILYQFTINLSLIFWFVPWIDELKKFSQQTKSLNS